MLEIRVGCCGFPLARPKYYETLDTVEIQQTFYQPPQIEPAQRWRAQAPKNFVFTLKAWQLIKHEPTSPTYRRLKLKIPREKRKRYGSFKPTDEVFAAWEATRLVASKLKAKLVLFQSPPSFTPENRNKKNMFRFFSSLERKGITLVWEPRGGWREGETRELCQELDLVHCVDPLKNRSSHGRLRYIQLHGRSGYPSRYDSKDLQKVLEMCEGKTYCLFNHRFMFEDGIEFLRLVQARSDSA